MLLRADGIPAKLRNTSKIKSEKFSMFAIWKHRQYLYLCRSTFFNHRPKMARVFLQFEKARPGWLVSWVETRDMTCFFACNLEMIGAKPTLARHCERASAATFLHAFWSMNGRKWKHLQRIF
jgi:beta-lactamase class D